MIIKIKLHYILSYYLFVCMVSMNVHTFLPVLSNSSCVLTYIYQRRYMTENFMDTNCSINFIILINIIYLHLPMVQTKFFI